MKKFLKWIKSIFIEEDPYEKETVVKTVYKGRGRPRKTDSRGI